MLGRAVMLIASSPGQKGGTSCVDLDPSSNAQHGKWVGVKTKSCTEDVAQTRKLEVKLDGLT